jgi:DNA repair exonuclease SbcCD ATPase subunit
MKIVFETLKWRNFLSTGNSPTEIDFLKHKTNLIVGANGSGKSTMMDALCFCLFGKAYRDINKGDLINTINNKDLFVECCFSVGSTKYKVERGQKPNVFKIYVNDEHVAQSAQTGDYQEFLETTVLNGWNIRTFKQIVVIGNANYIPFMQQTPAVRRDMVEELLDIKIFTSMSNILKEKVTKTKQTISENELKLQGIRNVIATTERMIELMKKNNDFDIAEKQKEIDKLQAQIEVHEEQLGYAAIIVKNLKASVDYEKITKIQDALRKLDMKEREVEVLKEQLKKQNKFFSVNQTCPTCTRDIDADYKHTIITENENAVFRHDDFLEKIEQKYLSLNEELKVLMEKEKELSKAENERNTIQSKIDSISNNKKYIQKDIDKLKVEKKEDLSGVKELQTEKEKLKLEEAEKERLLKDKDAQDIVQSFLKDGGIKTQIIKQNIPVLNKLINKYLAAMDFFVNFEIDEQFNETIKSRYRDTFKYASFSEGEKLRIDLSILFAWRTLAKMRNSLNSNLLILDEIFESSLDSNGTDELLKIIRDLDEDTKIFIISHKGDQLFDKFDNVIKFEKHQSFSRIVN